LFRRVLLHQPGIEHLRFCEAPELPHGKR